MTDEATKHSKKCDSRKTGGAEALKKLLQIIKGINLVRRRTIGPTAALLGFSLHCSPSWAAPASQAEMDLYTRIAALNLCTAIDSGEDFDRYAAISGETMAQVVKGAHGGRISQLGRNPVSIEELRRGSINSAILGAHEVCPERLPRQTREKVEIALRAKKDTERLTAIQKEDRPYDLDIQPSQEAEQGAPRRAEAGSVDAVVRIDGPASSGSGVLIGYGDGSYKIATACHVADKTRPGEELFVVTNDKRKHRTGVERLNRTGLGDLCYLSFDSEIKYRPAAIDDRTKLRLGMEIELIGWALPTPDSAASLRMTKGSITGLSLASNKEGYSVVYTTSPPSLPGMSGGPVMYKGRIIAIHGRAERFSSYSFEGKQMATAYSLGLDIRQAIKER